MAIFLHTRIRVSDFDQSIKWYQDHLGFQVKYCDYTFLNSTSVSAVPENPMIDTNILGLGAIGEELGRLAAILDFLVTQGCSMFFGLFSS